MGGRPGLTSELTTTDFTVNGLTSGGNIPILGLFFAFQESAQSFAHNFLENFSSECEFRHVEQIRGKMRVGLQKTISQMNGRLLASYLNT